MLPIPSDKQVDQARRAGYSVSQSIWNAGPGEIGLTWMTFSPEGERFEDNYPDADEAWRAAAHHHATGEQPRAGEMAVPRVVAPTAADADGDDAGQADGCLEPDVSMDRGIRASVRIDVRVESVEALRRAAFDEYAASNSDRRAQDLEAEFEDMYGTPERPDIVGLARLLFDNGRSMRGVSVQDSHATIHSAPVGSHGDHPPAIEADPQPDRRASYPPCGPR